MAGGGSKVDLSSGVWLTVGPSMGSWSSILLFGSSCRSSVIMLILVLIGSFLDYQVLPRLSGPSSIIRSFLDYRFVCWFRCLAISASGDTESKRSVS